MKTISSDLTSAINNGTVCTLFSIIAHDTSSRYFTDHDQELTVDGHLYIPSAGVTRLSMKTTANAEVSSQQVAATILDMPDDELKSGKWDSAKIEVALCAWQMESAGKLVIFKGSIGVIQWTDEGFRADIQNYLRDLGRNIGSTVTATCRHQLFGQGGAGQISKCGIDRGTYFVDGTITYVLTPKLKFKIANTGRPDSWGTNGFVKFTSGNNNGLTYEVKIHTVASDPIGESIELFLPCIGAIAVGDTYELTAGCDHTLATCQAKFGNVINFGGFPNIQTDINANILAG
jgi:uncharacterized phage protein (TIGR02218 family)